MAVVIVGAGTSGLAVAACLTQKSVPFILLEREDCFASLWQKYTYDRLHLHLGKNVCDLPHLPLPHSYPRYVPKELFIEYLHTYVKHFNIKPLYHRSVELAEFDEVDRKWKVKAKNTASGEVEEYSGRFLVVASGETAEPRVPKVEGLESFKGKVMHSTGYKNGKEFNADEHVLVVGSGNSGMEIALDLSNFGAKPSIIVRSPVHIVSRDMMYYSEMLLKYLSFSTVEKLLVMVSRIVYGDLSKYGLPWPTEGPFTMKIKYGKFSIIDLGTVNKIRNGEIQVLSAEIDKIRGNEVLFRDGKCHSFDSIIFCTGFNRSTQKWLKGGDDLLNEDGFAKASNFPNHWKGKNNLYCVGLAQRGFAGAKSEAQNAGVYDEYITVDKKFKNLFIYGDGNTKTIITGRKNFHEGTKTMRTATLSSNADDFLAKSIAFENTAGAEGHQAVALRIQGDRSAFFDCAMRGYQDTLYAHAHRQFYRNCEISGTIDFIFGYGTTLIQNSRIIVRKPMSNQQNIVVADGTDQKNMPTGIVLQNCEIMAEPALYPDRLTVRTFLARPWKAFSRAVFIENNIGDLIQPQGYIPWNPPTEANTDHCYFVEFGNTGAGANAQARAKFAKGLISKDEAAKYLAEPWIQASTWVPATGISYDAGFIKA
ncbi:hypothetical protein PIB30_067282 [Stylosanthes scabra]|uniref:Multifunctional fusion protein n=1 Tax=Stylosanthes scabra TaxID=79078 RepID=A0ABU6QMA9_9FABA|nr:hypothetical protein [Stylosanthes scabra]